MEGDRGRDGGRDKGREGKGKEGTPLARMISEAFLEKLIVS